MRINVDLDISFVRSPIALLYRNAYIYYKSKVWYISVYQGDAHQCKLKSAENLRLGMLVWIHAMHINADLDITFKRSPIALLYRSAYICYKSEAWCNSMRQDKTT